MIGEGRIIIDVQRVDDGSTVQRKCGHDEAERPQRVLAVVGLISAQRRAAVGRSHHPLLTATHHHQPHWAPSARRHPFLCPASVPFSS